ncbi:MAG: monovalent cation/H+ antiporter complex subunit F [Desulfatirhabdiaceae bacterium]
MTMDQLVNHAAQVTLILLLTGMFLAGIRLVSGPDPADRIMALDLISVLIVGFLAALSVYTRQSAVLDVAIAYALVAFLGTAALARWLERRAARRPGAREEP